MTVSDHWLVHSGSRLYYLINNTQKLNKLLKHVLFDAWRENNEKYLIFIFSIKKIKLFVGSHLDVTLSCEEPKPLENNLSSTMSCFFKKKY